MSTAHANHSGVPTPVAEEILQILAPYALAAFACAHAAGLDTGTLAVVISKPGSARRYLLPADVAQLDARTDFTATVLPRTRLRTILAADCEACTRGLDENLAAASLVLGAMVIYVDLWGFQFSAAASSTRTGGDA